MIINLLHSITASYLSNYYIYQPSINVKRLLCMNSHIYFLYDTYNILNEDYLDIIHHLLSIFSLTLFYIGYYEDIIIRLFYLAEMSNIAIFSHYLIMKRINNEYIIIFSSISEFIIYTYYRVFCMTYILFNEYELFYFTPLTPLLVIYYMSIDWSYRLLKKNLAYLNII